MTEKSDADGRDRRGRFAKGNRYSGGNAAHLRAHALRRAVRDSVTEVELQLLTMRLLKDAQAGDVASARLLLEYACGRPRLADPEVSLDLGPLADATGYATAFARLAQAAASGEVEPSAAVALAALLRQGADATVARDLEERLRAIEERDQREAYDA